MEWNFYLSKAAAKRTCEMTKKKHGNLESRVLPIFTTTTKKPIEDLAGVGLACLVMWELLFTQELST